MTVRTVSQNFDIHEILTTSGRERIVPTVENLKGLLDKVVRVSKDGGKTWECVYLANPVYTRNGQEKTLVGIGYLPVIEKAFQPNQSFQSIEHSLIFEPDPRIIRTTDLEMFTKESIKKSGILFETAAFSDYEYCKFEGVEGGYLSKWVASHKCSQRPNINLFINTPCEAPLTLVRSKLPADLKISLLFNKTFVPTEPTVPKPTEITESKAGKKHTWNIHSNTDGTLVHTDKAGRNERIGMIWWEAIRKGPREQVDPAKAVCVKREDLKDFLSATLKKQGLKDKELEGFVEFWMEWFKQTFNPEKAPYLLVQSVNADEYLPQMQVESKTAFELKRIYFRFEPQATNESGMDPKKYLAGQRQEQIGENAVLDLGGEIAPTPYAEYPDSWDEEAFNQAFINKHIYRV